MLQSIHSLRIKKMMLAFTTPLVLTTQFEFAMRSLIWGGRSRTGLYLMSAVEKWKKMLSGFNFIAAVEDPAG